MLLSVIKYFKGYVYVQLSGYAPERFLNLCGNHDILIWNLKPYNDGYCFCISVAGFKQLKPILKKTRTKVKIIKKTGMPFQVFRYRKRKIFFGGVFLFGALLYYLSGFIWNIEINGNSYLSNEVILDFLKQEEASFGTKISAIDCAKVEEDMRSRYSEVIWTSIKIYGTKMTVDIQENLLPEENYEQADDKVYDIVAAKDGIVTGIITRSGTPLVAAGTEVKKGDTLVSGRLEILNDDGEVGKCLYHSADADIMAKVTYQYRDEISKNYEDRVSVGEPRVNYELKILQYTIKNPFFKLEDSDYEIVTDTNQLKIAENFYLPVYICKQSAQQYHKQQKTYTEEQIKAIATENLKNYLSDLEEKGIQITKKNVMIVKKEKKYVAQGTIEAYESIVSYRPTEISDITSEERQPTDESD